jgi:methylphosphotriester-DNA--protein-cysteine methyltransferase
MSYVLLGADGRPYTSDVEGRWGGHRRMRIYGRLDCSSARAAIARGGYARDRVFFADEATALAAGYRPCARCCPDRYRVWKAAETQAAASIAAACQVGTELRKGLVRERLIRQAATETRPDRD